MVEIDVQRYLEGMEERITTQVMGLDKKLDCAIEAQSNLSTRVAVVEHIVTWYRRGVIGFFVTLFGLVVGYFKDWFGIGGA